MNQSMPIQGTNNSFTLGGQLSLLGKTTLFSRVALSPGAERKGGPQKNGNTANSYNDNDTSASTNLPNNNAQATMNKTLRSSTTTSTFKDTIQRGILSGAGILKK